MENAIVLLSCNEWKEYSSTRILGVFNDEDKLREKICNMFLNSELDWDGRNIKTLKNDAREEYEEFNDFEEDEVDNYNTEEDIEEIFENNKNQTLEEIMDTSIDDIDRRADYIMIQEFEMNKVD